MIDCFTSRGSAQHLAACTWRSKTQPVPLRQYCFCWSTPRQSSGKYRFSLKKNVKSIKRLWLKLRESRQTRCRNSVSSEVMTDVSVECVIDLHQLKLTRGRGLYLTSVRASNNYNQNKTPCWCGFM